MGESLRLSLLGTPLVLWHDQPLTGFTRNKTQALLFYLAVTAAAGRPAPTRDALLTLLWGEMGDTQARQNLRATLPELRRLLGDYLVIDRQRVSFAPSSSYWLDVAVLRRALTPGLSATDLAARQAAVDLYQGEFLQGFYVRDAPAFEAWVLEERELIHSVVVNGLTALVADYIQTDNLAAALTATRRLLVLEPWSEPTHRQQMWLLAQLGERTAALAQYELCRRALATEFGIEPLPETTALYEQIRDGRGTEGEVSSPPSTITSHQSTTLDVGRRLGDAAHGAGDSDLRAQLISHNLPLRTKLYGRQTELASLRKWIVEDGCQLVGIFGIGGQGKTALAATLVRELKEATPPADAAGRFTHLLWQSLVNAPPLAEVLQEWVSVLSDQTVTTLPDSFDQQLSQLLEYLQRHRALLILDNLESILQHDERSGYYRPGYEAYGQLVHRLIAGGHRSCLLLTSRERPQDLSHVEEETPAARSLSLAGLSAAAGQQMLAGRGLSAQLSGLDALVQHYSGNPLALKLAAETVQEIFDNNIAAFLQADTLVFDDVRDVLDQQFARLTPLERELLLWLAIVREPVPFNTLRNLLAQPPDPRRILEAVRSLQRRSLIEKFTEGFGLQNVVTEYTTALLIENVVHELLADKLVTTPAQPVTSAYLNRYAFSLAQVKEYVRASQSRLILQPIVERLLARLGRVGMEECIRHRLNGLRTAPRTPGYAAANLLYMLFELGSNREGYDFSQLYIRQAYLRGVNLPRINFAGAEIVESVFTEPFGIVYSAIFSPDGRYLAAGMSEGAIYLWHATTPIGHPQLAQIIQAHKQSINQLAFAERITASGEKQLVLASASADKTVGFWALTEQLQMRWQVQLTHPQQQSVIAVGFSTDSQRLTSVDVDGHVFVWEVRTQVEARLGHDFATQPTRLGLVAFSGDGQTVAVGQRDGAVQLWNLATGDAGLVLPDPTGSTSAVAISKDGQRLITGGRNGQLWLWSLPSGELQQMIETKMGAIDALAFGVDGNMLSSTHGDRAVRVWAVDAQRGVHLRHTLLGHRQMIWSTDFGPLPTAIQAPDPTGGSANVQQLLVTGSSDQTVRIWDAENGQSLYTLQGQPRALALMAICPLPATQPTMHAAAAWLLAAVSYDQLVHLWQGHGAQVAGAHRTFHGTPGLPYTVAISPDARLVASAGSAYVIDLWDVVSEQRRQTFHGHTSSVLCLAFHPAGTLLASGSTDGTVRLWAVPQSGQAHPHAGAQGLSGQPVAILAANPRYVYDLTFSPDGHLLAAVGADRSLRLWDITHSPPVELVAARKTVQEEGEQDLFAVAFSPDGSKLACSSNHLIHVWDLPSDYGRTAPNALLNDGLAARSQREQATLLRHHTGWIFTLAFSPDGTSLASGGADCTVCLWEVSAESTLSKAEGLNPSVTTGAPRAVLRGHTETIYKVLFSPDGTFVLSCSFDGSIKFWDPQSGACINTLVVEGPYAGMNISGVTGITAAQKAALQALGAVESA